MKADKMVGYLQMVFVALYIIIGFLLLSPILAEKINSGSRIGFGIILLFYGGYRGYVTYRKYFSGNE